MFDVHLTVKSNRAPNLEAMIKLAQLYIVLLHIIGLEHNAGDRPEHPRTSRRAGIKELKNKQRIQNVINSNNVLSHRSALDRTGGKNNSIMS